MGWGGSSLAWGGDKDYFIMPKEGLQGGFACSSGLSFVAELARVQKIHD